MLRERLGAVILFGGVEPWNEPQPATAQPSQGASDALKSLAAAELVIGITPYASEPLKRVAHVLLPIGTFAETSGTFVNFEGLWQSFTAAARLNEEARPGWKVLRVLGTELGLPGFEYQSSDEVSEELRHACGELAGGAAAAALGYHGKHRVEAVVEGGAALRVIDVPMYQVDAIVRRAGSLQRTAEGRAEPVAY